MDVAGIQQWLIEHEVDGWLLADFHGYNFIATRTLGIKGMLTRRSFYYIPAQGNPVALVNAIEVSKFKGLPGKMIAYAGYKMLEQKLKETVSGTSKIAMEYSALGRLPYVAMVDAGTIELIRQWNIEIVSSADLVAHFQSRLTAEQIAAHRMAARNILEIKDKVFAFISKTVRDNKPLTEFDVVRFTLDQFAAYDMEADHSPICGVDANAGDPHYEPDATHSSPIQRDQLVLCDMWAKVKSEHGVYADITWMAYTGAKSSIPNRYNEMFAVLTKARDRAVQFLRDNIEKRPVLGAEVDDACRETIRVAGYGDYFVHRTGHSISADVHGTGPNIDNLETEDRRRLQKGHLFSIEPGLYMKDCGFRTEIDVLIGHEGVEVTTLPLQTEITPLL